MFLVLEWGKGWKIRRPGLRGGSGHCTGGAVRVHRSTWHCTGGAVRVHRSFWHCTGGAVRDHGSIWHCPGGSVKVHRSTWHCTDGAVRVHRGFREGAGGETGCRRGSGHLPAARGRGHTRCGAEAFRRVDLPVPCVSGAWTGGYIAERGIGEKFLSARAGRVWAPPLLGAAGLVSTL